MTLTIFENAKLFDGVSAELRDPSFVLVEGSEIREVSDRPLTSQHAQRIDCRGRVLMPGLIDSHVHVYLNAALSMPEPPITYRAQYAHRFLRHMLACGFTTIRDVGGGDHGLAMALRDGFVEGPRFFYGGLCLTQTGGHGDYRPTSEPTDYCACAAGHNALAVRADGVDECIKATREELRKGASHIKITASGGVLSESDPLHRCQYSEPEIRAIVAECERRGAYVCAHCHPPQAIRRCVEYGVRSIEHGTLMDDATAAFVAERGAYVVPTLAVIFALVEQAATLPEAAQRKLRAVHAGALDGLVAMQRAGVKMGFGTDLMGDQYTKQGTEFTLRREVLTSLEILRSATSVNAEILQMEGKLGVIRPGALADLIVVAGDPLQDVDLLAANGAHLTHIMLDGRFIKRS